MGKTNDEAISPIASGLHTAFVMSVEVNTRGKRTTRTPSASSPEHPKEKLSVVIRYDFAVFIVTVTFPRFFLLLSFLVRFLYLYSCIV